MRHTGFTTSACSAKRKKKPLLCLLVVLVIVANLGYCVYCISHCLIVYLVITA